MRSPETGQRPWLPWVLVFGVGAAAGTSAPRLLQSTEAPRPEAASLTAAATVPADVSSKLRPALHLIGESLGIGPDTQQAEAVRSIGVVLQFLAKKDPNDDRAKALKDLRARLEDPGSAASASGVTTAEVLDQLSLPFEGLKDAEEVAEARKQLLGFLRGETSDARLLQLLRDRARDTRVDIDFVVACVADYVDSNVAWHADQHFESIQAAMVTAGFTLDRFYLADWPREGPVSAAHAHRESPGAIVFRGRPDDHGHTPLRVVLLVPETPTAGLHREALHNALTLARTWDPRSTEPLRILGPTFSGSIASLRAVLEDDPAIWQRREVRIISGTATAASNQRILEAGATYKGNQFVSFSTTTHPFPEWLRGLKRYLQTINADWAEGHRMAVLHEGNTTFGSQSVGSDKNGLLGIFPGARTLAFPLHVSRLRDAAADAATPARSALTPRALIPLTTRDSHTGTDQLPSLTPAITGASVQTTMSAVFDSLKHQRFRVALIVATDERDALFLAREVRRASPDTQLVFFGSYMLMLHPEYASYTRGSIVVTSYLLAGTTAKWGVSAPSQARRHFQSWPAEGLYNAALALTAPKEAPVDYEVPLTPDPLVSAVEAQPVHLGPPVWISTVGRTGFVALAAYRGEEAGSFLHLRDALPPPKPGDRRDPDPDLGPTIPLPTLVLGVGLFLAVLWHASVVLRQVWPFLREPAFVRDAAIVTCRKAWLQIRHKTPKPDAGVSEEDARFNQHQDEIDDWIDELMDQRVTGFKRVFVLPWKPLDVRRTAQACVHATFGVIGLLLAWGVYLAVRASGSASYELAIAAGVATAAVPVLLSLTDHTGTLPASEQAQGTKFALALALGIVLGVPILAIVLGRLEPADGPVMPLPHAPLMEADRGLMLLSLVSPTIPILCFALCGYVWLVWQLRVLSFIGRGYKALFARAVVRLQPAAPELRAMAAAHGAATQAAITKPLQGEPAGAAPLLAEPSARVDAIPTREPESDATGQSAAPDVSAPQPPPAGGPAPADDTKPLPEDSGMVAVLLAGELMPQTTVRHPAMKRWREGFTRAFDTTLPTRERWRPLAVALMVVLLVAPVVWLRVYTLEGPRFSGLFKVATLGCLLLAVLALAHTVDQWKHLRGALARLGRSPLVPAFGKVRSFHLDWRLNLRLPRRSELALLVAETDALEGMLARQLDPLKVGLTSEGALRERTARELLTSSSLKADGACLVDALADERHADHIRLMSTNTFMRVWGRTQRYLPLLQGWYDAQGRLPDKAPHSLEKPAERPTPDIDWLARDWFDRAESAVALTLAFVIRDLLSRIIAGLSAACACFVLVLTAHLLYSFPGRSTMLTIDWIAVGASGAIAVSILVAMERSVVLSHLWDSAPGRISFNREFVQRLALYGALPVLTLVSALFPEMGDTLFGWLAPARQLAGF